MIPQRWICTGSSVHRSRQTELVLTTLHSWYQGKIWDKAEPALWEQGTLHYELTFAALGTTLKQWAKELGLDYLPIAKIHALQQPTISSLPFNLDNEYAALGHDLICKLMANLSSAQKKSSLCGMSSHNDIECDPLVNTCIAQKILAENFAFKAKILAHDQLFHHHGGHTPHPPHCQQNKLDAVFQDIITDMDTMQDPQDSSKTFTREHTLIGTILDLDSVKVITNHDLIGDNCTLNLSDSITDQDITDFDELLAIPHRFITNSSCSPWIFVNLDLPPTSAPHIEISPLNVIHQLSQPLMPSIIQPHVKGVVLQIDLGAQARTCHLHNLLHPFYAVPTHDAQPSLQSAGNTIHKCHRSWAITVPVATYKDKGQAETFHIRYTPSMLVKILPPGQYLDDHKHIYSGFTLTADNDTSKFELHFIARPSSGTTDIIIHSIYRNKLQYTLPICCPSSPSPTQAEWINMLQCVADDMDLVCTIVHSCQPLVDLPLAHQHSLHNDNTQFIDVHCVATIYSGITLSADDFPTLIGHAQGIIIHTLIDINPSHTPETIHHLTMGVEKVLWHLCLCHLLPRSYKTSIMPWMTSHAYLLTLTLRYALSASKQSSKRPLMALLPPMHLLLSLVRDLELTLASCFRILKMRNGLSC